MSLKDAVISVIAFTRNRTLKLVEDLSDDQLALSLAGPGGAKVNHPAWVLGHLLLSDYSFRQLVTGEPAPSWVDDAARTVYGNKSEPSSDKARYKPKQFYIDKLLAVRAQIAARLQSMTEAEYGAPHPDPARRERFPTVGHMITFYGTWHEAYHGGQLSTWRRALGLPPVA